MWSGIHPTTEAHDHPQRAAGDYVVGIQHTIISKTMSPEDQVEVRVLGEDEVQLEADRLLQLTDDARAVDVIDGDGLACERLDEDLCATAQPEGLRKQAAGARRRGNFIIRPSSADHVIDPAFHGVKL